MGITVNAIYENGKLVLLEPLDLQEGQQVQVTILTERDRVLAALKDLLVDTSMLYQDDEDFDEEALMQEIQEGFKGVTLSDIIIQERSEGM